MGQSPFRERVKQGGDNSQRSNEKGGGVEGCQHDEPRRKLGREEGDRAGLGDGAGRNRAVLRSRDLAVDVGVENVVRGASGTPQKRSTDVEDGQELKGFEWGGGKGYAPRSGEEEQVGAGGRVQTH